jgi:hypothetical protein
LPRKSLVKQGFGSGPRHRPPKRTPEDCLVSFLLASRLVDTETSAVATIAVQPLFLDVRSDKEAEVASSLSNGARWQNR